MRSLHRILVLGAAAAALLLLAASCTKPANTKIGLQLYSIRGEVAADLEGSLAKVAEIGYSFVEAANYNGEEGLFYGMQPADFKDLCNKHGLEFTSSHINGPDPNVTSEEECLAWWEKAIAAHKAADVPYIVQPSMRRSAYDSLPGLKRYCELFDKVGAMCNASGIKFGYHNHNREFTTTFEGENGEVRLYDYMLANTSPENVFFQIDLYWIQVGEASAIEYFEANKGRFTSWHVKDELEIGASGKMDFAELYKYADISGMKYQVVEQEAFAEGLTPFESIKASYDFLAELLSK